MNFIKMFLLMAFAAAACNSETTAINISGSIVDSSGKAIAGAEIRLERAKISTKSDENGVFTLTGIGTVGIKSPRQSPSTTTGCEPFIIQNSKLIFTLAAQSAIDVTVYGIQGQVISRIKQSMNAGSHALALPITGDGLYLYRVKISNAEYVLKGTCMGRTSGGSLKIATGKLQEALAKAAKTAMINDILSITKDGFLDDHNQVTQPTMEMPPIKMIANAGNVVDIDGNVYQSVKIGNQVWMTENLRVTRYNDGTAIPLVMDSTAWGALITPGRCWYMNDSATNKTYGALYNWYTVNTGKLAFKGWHVASDTEWTILTNYLGGANVAGGKLKEAGLIHWDTPNGATNETGFSALPGGSRSFYGTFFNVGYYGYWWSSTAASDAPFSLVRGMYYDNAIVTRYYSDYTFGYSVRCVRD